MDQNKTTETVSRSYPYRFVSLCIVTFLAGVLLTSAVIWFYIYREPAASYAENYRMLARLKGEIFYLSLVIYAVTSVFVIGGIAFLSLLYSHRVAGPLYKLGLFVHKTAVGDFTGSVALRRKDVIHPLAEEVNRLVAFYRAAVAQLETRTHELDSAARVISAAQPPTGTGEDLQKALIHISDKAGEIGDILHRFRL
jgi:methyl-accepting chemotaxis protein